MSERQREANRINGSKGRPRTPEGKAICAQNSRRHSLTCQKLILDTEEEAQLNEMMDDYMDLLKPMNIEEKDLVREIVSGKWRQERWWNIEAAMLDLCSQDAEPAIVENYSEITPESKIAYGLAEKHGALKAIGLVNLYESRMRRLHERARRDLDRLQAARTPKLTKITKPAPDREDPTPEPISYRSFISEEEQARLDQGKSRPNIGLDLPENDPLDRPRRPKAA
jgi:hypothetical protein